MLRRARRGRRVRRALAAGWPFEGCKDSASSYSRASRSTIEPVIRHASPGYWGIRRKTTSRRAPLDPNQTTSWREGKRSIHLNGGEDNTLSHSQIEPRSSRWQEFQSYRMARKLMGGSAPPCPSLYNVLIQLTLGCLVEAPLGNKYAPAGHLGNSLADLRHGMKGHLHLPLQAQGHHLQRAVIRAMDGRESEVVKLLPCHPPAPRPIIIHFPTLSSLLRSMAFKCSTSASRPNKAQKIRS